MIADHDTIVAPATAQGGAIAIVRVSGQEALEICDRIFHGSRPLAAAAGNTVHYGRILDGERVVDDVLATVFRAPHSYTGEDAVEISCHGSSYIVSEVLRLLIEAGGRMAQPGEFTIRAYLAGKLDLSQAEAVADLIASSTRAAHTMATNQMRGGYSDELEGLRDKLLNLTSLLELELDFSEEDVEFADRRALRETMELIGREIDRLRSSFALGNAIKEGVAVAIVGAPNVGKSTLLNRLLNEERAMVSEIAGTTRDVIEERANIGGVLFRFLDTAGIRTTGDRLEQMGIERTMESIRRAQVVIRLIDAQRLDEAMPQIEVRPEQRVLTVVNKMDAAPEGFRLPEGAIGISAKRGEGIDELCGALRNAVDTEGLYHGDPVVSNSRHYEALTAARKSLDRALAGMDEGLPADLLSEEIRPVIGHLGEITGRGAIAPDEVLENIFSKFCIGK
ncbi:tRNA uridine-5-carboxymethylaminomethyl(34) synthesis GTPase MnmE [uncultured Alistipes sp.]|uniref:tRNA uridine-5-carboxymethylaminomethyl(34) synthesis GTPase MnmE n=1 Tax=uncultured Alistipes sp. TaxID=538949 RepID=UPI0028064A1D|nr:tRNA uridine-5-carboxymethylaminomethyl(34) synthesis GTPase MnmE [uncultured Alistipes sp.]